MDRFLVKFITISYSQFTIPSGTFSLFWSKIFNKKRQDLQRFERAVFVVNEISLKYNTRVIRRENVPRRRIRWFPVYSCIKHENQEEDDGNQDRKADDKQTHEPTS